MSLPLDGITVVSLEQAIAAPLASRHLADWGARVIKIERPDGGDFARNYDTVMNGLSSQFLWTNRSKESLAVDLKTPDGRATLERLLGTADVFLQNLAPGAAARMELDSAAVLKRHPRIVSCDLSGYGSTGPYSNRKAYDLLVQCESGFVSINGSPEEPAKCGLSIVDIAGGMALLQGILMGLLRRERVGTGMSFEVSLFDAIGEWMSYPAYYTTGSGKPPPRSGLRHATIAPYGPFTTADDQVIFLAVQNEREWRSFCRTVLDRADLSADPLFADNAARVRNRDALEAIVGQRVRSLSTERALALLSEADIANARLNSVDEFLSHPQITSRGRLTNVDSEFGPQRVLLPAILITGCEPVMNAVPKLGEHNAAIADELRTKSKG